MGWQNGPKEKVSKAFKSQRGVTRGLKGPSIGRVFGNAKTILNIAFSELGIDKPNPLSGVFIDTSIGSVRRNGFTSVDLLRLKQICRQYDDELRHILALICDTGMRLSEAVGLRHRDLVLVHECPACNCPTKCSQAP